jgi:hypothetical protein
LLQRTAEYRFLVLAQKSLGGELFFHQLVSE